MRRRQLLGVTLGLMLVAASPALSSDDTLEYLPGDIKTALNEGKTVFVDYYTNWCGTCKRQERVVEQLRGENPAYNAAMIFIKVDWDVYANHEVSRSRNIPRRSTLVVLKGDQELGRIVAGTGKEEIKALMDKGLNSGTADNS